MELILTRIAKKKGYTIGKLKTLSNSTDPSRPPLKGEERKSPFKGDLEGLGLGALVAKSVRIKERIVEEDPTEKGLRKALNLGHTAGHALESLAMEQGRTVLHGYAVAWRLICELYLSVVKCGFPKDKLR